MRIPNGDGVEETIAYPTIGDVPVAFPRFGDWYIHAPLSVGDFVLCLFSDTSLDAYRQAGIAGIPVDPLDIRQHHISDAIALPMNVYPTNGEVGATPSHLVIAKKGSAVAIHLKANEIALGGENPLSYVALAQKVDSALADLKVALAPLAGPPGGVLPVPPVDGTVYAVAVYTALTSLLATGWPATVASTTVKAD